MAKITTSKTAQTPNPDTPKTKKPTVKRTKDHDIFVKGILSINALVLKLLLHYIPKNMHPFIDFSTLKILSDVQINRKLKYVQADSIHECYLNVDKLPKSARNEKNLPLFRFCFL
jgi:Putative transposase, YhgA-like